MRLCGTPLQAHRGCTRIGIIAGRLRTEAVSNVRPMCLTQTIEMCFTALFYENTAQHFIFSNGTFAIPCGLRVTSRIQNRH